MDENIKTEEKAEPEAATTVVEENIVAEIVDLPNAPVVTNSQPEVIEAEIVATLPENPEAPEASQTEPELPVNPEVNPAPSDPETTPPAPEKTEEKAESEISTVRSDETGDKVYALRAGKRYWIKNPETLAKMGFYLGKEKRLPFSELLGYPEGEPIDLTVLEAVYPWDKPEQPTPTATSPIDIWQ